VPEEVAEILQKMFENRNQRPAFRRRSRSPKRWSRFGNQLTRRRDEEMPSFSVAVSRGVGKVSEIGPTPTPNPHDGAGSARHVRPTQRNPRARVSNGPLGTQLAPANSQGRHGCAVRVEKGSSKLAPPLFQPVALAAPEKSRSFVSSPRRRPRWSPPGAV